MNQKNSRTKIEYLFKGSNFIFLSIFSCFYKYLFFLPPNLYEIKLRGKMQKKSHMFSKTTVVNFQGISTRFFSVGFNKLVCYIYLNLICIG